MISSNIKYLRRQHKISQQELAEAMSLPRTTLGDYERGKTEPNLSMLTKLSDFFSVKIDGLIREDLSYQEYEQFRTKEFKVLAISTDRDDNSNIELVDTKAEAGYLQNFQDPEYIRDLPKIAFPNIKEGTFRGFEIQGDSMLPIEPGSIIISSYVEKLSEIKDGKTYVVVSKDDGLVYKRVHNLKEEKKLTLISDNESYRRYDIDYDAISEVWQYYAHLSFSDSKATFNSMLEHKLDDIQRKLNEVHEKIV